MFSCGPCTNPRRNRCDPGMVRRSRAAVLAGGLVTVASPASLRELPEDQRRRLARRCDRVASLRPGGASPRAAATALALVRASPSSVARARRLSRPLRYYPPSSPRGREGRRTRVRVRYQGGNRSVLVAFHWTSSRSPASGQLASRRGPQPRPLPRELRLLAVDGPTPPAWSPTRSPAHLAAGFITRAPRERASPRRSRRCASRGAGPGTRRSARASGAAISLKGCPRDKRANGARCRPARIRGHPAEPPGPVD